MYRNNDHSLHIPSQSNVHVYTLAEPFFPFPRQDAAIFESDHLKRISDTLKVHKNTHDVEVTHPHAQAHEHTL